MVLTIASNAHELAARAADNARFDMQSALEEVATAEKIIRRCEIVVGGVGGHTLFGCCRVGAMVFIAAVVVLCRQALLYAKIMLIDPNHATTFWRKNRSRTSWYSSEASKKPTLCTTCTMIIVFVVL